MDIYLCRRSMKDVLDKSIALIKLTNQFALTERAIYKNDSEKMENDAEHSYQLAFLGWQLNDLLKLGLDNTRIMQYALAHDLVEVYAGDTDAMGTQGDASTKAAREHEALHTLQQEYGLFGSFVTTLEQYEKREDEEACFVYALDKLLPTINIYLNNGRDWKRKKKSLAEIREYKDHRIAVHPQVEKIYNELIERIQQHYGEYFDV